MKTKLLLLFGFLTIGLGFSQQLSVSPDPFTEDEQITITASGLAWDSAGDGDVYLWAWHFDEDGMQINNPPATGDDFGNSPETAKFTDNGDGTFSYTLTPTEFYNNTGISRIGLLVKSKDGTSQTDNFYFDVGRFQLTLAAPERDTTFVVTGSTFAVDAETTLTADFQLFADGNLVDTQNNVKAYRYDYTLNSDTDFRLVATETGGTDVIERKFSAMPQAAPTEAPVPTGMVDGFNYDPKNPDTATFVLYAPDKAFVHLIGNFDGNGFNVADTYLMKKDSNKERFWITLDLASVPANSLEYQYVIEKYIRIADPYSTLILDEFNDKDIEATVYPNIPAYPKDKTSQAVSYVQLDEAAYDWKINDFAPAAKEDMVIYEILVRDFDDNHDFKEVMKRLDYLQDLGVNAIELMPIQEFDGNLSWGYNPSFHMALDKYYGTRNDLKTLVDECHSRGIAIFLDVVYNHATGQNPYYRMYNTSNGGTGGQPSVDSPFFNPVATHSYSVFNDFNHQKTATQEYVKHTTQYWIDEFKIDGFRWDLTKGFTQNCTPDDENCTNSYQADRVNVLEQYADDQWEADPDFYIIFEHLGTNKEEKEWADYRLDEGKGIMLWDNQNYQYNQATMGYDQDDFGGISYKVKGFDNPAAVGYMESHDEERLMFKNLEFGNASGSYSVKELNTALDRMKLAGAFFFTVPGPKMIWQFGELGYDTSIFTCADGTLPQPYPQQQCKLDEKPDGWDFLDQTDRVALHDSWKKMIFLKKSEPIFKTGDFTMNTTNDALKTIHLTDPNASGDAINYVTLLGNFGVTEQSIDPEFQETGTWYDLMDGSNITVTDQNAMIDLAPGEYHIYANKASNLGFNEATQNSTFTVYPNPAKNFIRLDETVENLIIYNLTGKKMKEYRAEELKNERVDISALPTGFYLLKTEKNGTIQIGKLIIK